MDPEDLKREEDRGKQAIMIIVMILLLIAVFLAMAAAAAGKWVNDTLMVISIGYSFTPFY